MIIERGRDWVFADIDLVMSTPSDLGDACASMDQPPLGWGGSLAVWTSDVVRRHGKLTPGDTEN